MVNYEESFCANLEHSYRNIFDVLRLGESFMDSTPIFNGALIAFRRYLFDPLRPHTIADDTEIALRIREKGYKAVFDPRVVVYAFTPRQFKSRLKQKIRRAQGIIQSFSWHKNILFNPHYGKYGLIIFPCEFFMFFISPLVFLSIAFLLPLLFYEVSLSVDQVILILTIVALFLGLMSTILYLLKRQSVNPLRFFATFLEHQIFLILALISLILRKGTVKWEKIEN